SGRSSALRLVMPDMNRPQGFDGLVDALADPAAPTAGHDPAEIGDVHIADSLAGLEVPEVRAARPIADLGAGAGLPGLVLAIELPEAEVVLLDSVGKKCAWMAATANALGLQNVRVACARAEELEGGGFDVVTARA